MPAPAPREPFDWRTAVAAFQNPSPARASWQLATTLSLHVLAWVAMWFASSISWWLLPPLVLLTGGLTVRVFILFHDAAHGSLLPGRRANDWVGRITGLLTFTPYRQWRADHAVHHGATGDLDRRGVGDVWTMTVREYLQASRWDRLRYRFARHPFVLFGIAPYALFLGMHRFPRRGAAPRERWSVWLTNLALLGMVAGLGSVFGFGTYVVLQLAVLHVAGAVGIWLFYVQHQFEHAYWERGSDWDFAAAALQGSSFLRLPRVLQWFTGNIGFHHVHHLSPRIPNYHLERCHRALPQLQSVPPLSLLGSLRTLRLRLWDEVERKLVDFGHVRALRRRLAAEVAAGPANR